MCPVFTELPYRSLLENWGESLVEAEPDYVARRGRICAGPVSA
jgi:hypothetical protein